MTLLVMLVRKCNSIVSTDLVFIRKSDEDQIRFLDVVSILTSSKLNMSKMHSSLNQNLNLKVNLGGGGSFVFPLTIKHRSKVFLKKMRNMPQCQLLNIYCYSIYHILYTIYIQYIYHILYTQYYISYTIYNIIILYILYSIYCYVL